MASIRCYASQFGPDICGRMFTPCDRFGYPFPKVGELHFEDKICDVCKSEGLRIDAERCRILPKKYEGMDGVKIDRTDLNSQLVNAINRRNGKGPIDPFGNKEYFLPVTDPDAVELLGGSCMEPTHAAVINNRNNMKGDFIVVYRDAVPANCRLNPVQPELIDDEGKCHFLYKYGGLCLSNTHRNKAVYTKQRHFNPFKRPLVASETGRAGGASKPSLMMLVQAAGGEPHRILPYRRVRP